MERGGIEGKGIGGGEHERVNAVMAVSLLQLFAVAAALAAPPPPDAFDKAIWAQFSRSPALRHETTTVQIATNDASTLDKPYTYLLRRRVTGLRGTVTDWIDSRNCPAVREVLTTMRSLEMPSAQPDDSDVAIPVMGDGIDYSLRAPSSWSFGAVTISANIGTPLAAWVETSLTALAPCWTPKRPEGKARSRPHFLDFRRPPP